MTREEAIHVLESIRDLYPKYDISKEKAKMLIPILLPMDYELVRGRLAVHVAAHPYAPTINEIAAYPEQTNEQLDTLSVWRKEADAVPHEIKQIFHEKMAELLKDKAYDNH